MKRKIPVLLAALALMFTAAATAHDAQAYITDARELHGSDYASNPALAASLDSVFSGNVKLYSDVNCTLPVAVTIGSRAVPPGLTYYTRDLDGNVYSGTSCYIYANAVYAALFGDIPFHGDPRAWRNSERVLKNAPEASFSLFSSANVQCGALLRTTRNADGSYNSNYGHSVIILKYDEKSVTYLEGNGDGNGIVRVTTRSWSDLNSVSLAGRGYKISFIVQPTESFYNGLLTGARTGPDYVGYFRPVRPGAVFSDVDTSGWYASGVAAVSSLGLMDGRGGGIFAPSEPIKVSEAVTLAARFLSLYYDDRHDFSGGGIWYDPYYDYCGIWGIDTSFASPSEPISRSDFARLMSRALPAAARTDTVPSPSFGDVPASAGWSGPIYTLARSGILKGSGGQFYPASTLTRAEAACVLARMADRSLR